MKPTKISILITLLSACNTGSSPESRPEGEAEKEQIIKVEAFVDGEDLTFVAPEGWSFSQDLQFVSVATFEPPLTGLAEALPSGLQVDILALLPSLDTATEQMVMLRNGEWKRNSVPELGKSVVFYVSHALGVAVAGTQTGPGGLSDADTVVIENVVKSVSIGGN